MKKYVKRSIAALLAVTLLMSGFSLPNKSKVVEAAADDDFVLVLDPGHGGSDGGTGANGLREANVNLAIAGYCRDYIQANTDTVVVMTRTGDVDVKLENRSAIAGQVGADLFVSFHINAQPNGGSGARGIDVYVPWQKNHDEMASLGSKIVANANAVGMPTHSGVTTRLTENNTTYWDGSLADYYSVIRETVKVGVKPVLIEHGFATNPNDAAYFKNAANLKALGEADAKAIIQQYNLGYNYKDSTFNKNTTDPYVGYQAHVQELGWMNYMYQGETVGTRNRGLRIEALNVKLANVPDSGVLVGNSYIEGTGWVNTKGNAKTGITLGSTGTGKRIEAIQLDMNSLPGYSIQYRVYMQNKGWLDWCESGKTAGLPGSGLRIEAVQIQLVTKSSLSNTNSSVLGVAYETHAQDYGWQNWVQDSAVAGTTGESKRLEAIKIDLLNAPAGASVTARAHIQDYGWRDYNLGTSGTIGTQGEGKRIEAIALTLNGVSGYALEYRVHIQDVGWSKWVSQGETAGTAGFGRRLEAMQIRVVPTTQLTLAPTIKARAHVQDMGWLDWCSENSLVGTSGLGRRMESINLSLENAPGMYLSGSVHVQNKGWINYSTITKDTVVGSSGEGLRIESINFTLNGTNAYKIQYRTHIQNVGWTPWIDQGSNAGTQGQSLRLEAMEFRIVAK